MKFKELWITLTQLSISYCSTNWDYLIFSQRWPITACTEWEDRSKNNTCSLPAEGLWIIHGIWPTKIGTKGPWNCNATWHFDDNILNPIKFELEEYWTNIESNTELDSLWKHEWMKHGTCAATLPRLDNELKYFDQGLKWIQKFDMKYILPLRQIVPREEGYSLRDIFDAIQSKLAETPIIQCVIDKYTKQSLISEIRVCFDKNLKLIDCKAVQHFGDFDVVDEILTNCNINKTVVYPESVPKARVLRPTLSSAESSPSLFDVRRKLLSLYKIVQMIIKLTF